MDGRIGEISLQHQSDESVDDEVPFKGSHEADTSDGQERQDPC